MLMTQTSIDQTTMLMLIILISTLITGLIILNENLKDIKEILANMRKSQFEMQKVELAYIDMHCKYMNVFVDAAKREQQEKSR